MLQSVRVARENMHLNGAGSRVSVRQANGLGSEVIRRAAPFDLLVANILAGPLVGLSGEVARAVECGGYLVLSGLLVSQAPAVVATYRAKGFALESHHADGGLVYARSGAELIIGGFALRGCRFPIALSWSGRLNTCPMFQTFEVETNPADAADRVRRLRALMSKAKLDAFLVPRADEFQGEYVPPSAERLKWLTGFSGSAGCAAICEAVTAALFVDGRYTVQVQAETDAESL